MNANRGWSLVETLVVLAIIGVMMAIAVPRYTKAVRMAKDVAADEAKRQQYLARDSASFLDNFHPFDCTHLPASYDDDSFLRECARAAFRQTIDAGKFDIYVTEVLYAVSSDAEFAAYFHTLIDAQNNDGIFFDPEGNLMAFDPQGNQFLLPPIERAITPGDPRPYVVGWDFLSVNLADTSYGNISTTALLSDGARNKIKYPGPFPGTRTVAELSARFMAEVYKPRTNGPT